MEIDDLSSDINVVKITEKFAVSIDVKEYGKNYPIGPTRNTYSINVEKDQSGRFTVTPINGGRSFEFMRSSPVTLKIIGELLIRASEL